MTKPYEREGGAATPTRSQRLLWGLVVNGAAFAAWAAEASGRQRAARGRQTPFVRRTL
jgi:hypothetical protein